MKRRDFLKTSAIGITAPSILMSDDEIRPNMNDPLILSTWEHGLPANDVAWKVLQNGGSAMDAAEAGAKVPEADPTSTSVGFGGLPDEQGNVTLDACVMDSDGNAGSVAFLQNIKHPVSVARKVMEETKHVMLVGEGARQFAVSHGFEEIDLLTDESKMAWEKWKKKRREMMPHETHDTISVLVQDKNGDLAGTCTTSGWAYKMHGRVGDSPIIGAGLFVDNEIGCAAATGLGEEVIKTTGSFLVVELMRQGYNPTAACEEALNRVIKKHNGNLDFQIAYIAIRKDGNIGSACIKDGFEYALLQKGKNNLYKIKGTI
ncbi:MAG: N(4)-(beta-N-acetylglucosaminyl)-L-asparaginase [Candidatus Marinimicrobia bacterium]|jgi:L-asparaginase/N4-(beta-N-acetylglucosaminyl)-L-asparaginase|nr:N(4)-(beta-N-acetylglucosaminyl)-L-asparaginase [Candidatus Neomarinimicrobiota bacterium]MDP7165782.1 N(4)-(beta-N-acetylglucosaminyl)-L-asparaginase [Candidatus Neomarinimicrobiota bacterium]HJM12120.1 N(4)-(beta-N-acetylglucosaminyl)-L-asparaginase [Candidatus Neomarinimicrobiota bacterium]|tara:strand:+ start:5224 stop:6174 length:951 start_codon:yes stop_codon:yes gene_type:complete